MMLKRMKSSQKVAVNVLVSDGSLPEIDTVAKKLKEAGLSNLSCQKALGTITGAALPDAFSRLRAVAGVEAVEPSREFQLPQPDSELQ